MSISLLQELSGKTLPLTVNGGEHADAVHILVLAGHVVADVEKAVRTSTGWMNPSAVVLRITPSGRRMLRLFPPGANGKRRLGVR
jgi:hypothetical protein